MGDYSITVRRWLQKNMAFLMWAGAVLLTQGSIFRGRGPWIGPSLAIVLLALATMLSDRDQSYRGKLTTAAEAVLVIASISLLGQRDRIAWMQNDFLPFCATIVAAILLYDLLGRFIKAMTDD